MEISRKIRIWFQEKYLLNIIENRIKCQLKETIINKFRHDLKKLNIWYL